LYGGSTFKLFLFYKNDTFFPTFTIAAASVLKNTVYTLTLELTERPGYYEGL
jgi:hypothetical protein